MENRSYRINVRPGQLKGRSSDDILRKTEHLKSSLRCKVEHMFARIKLQMGYRKTRCRGIEKNANRLNILLGLGNLFPWDGLEKRCDV